jgi:hypothetical protein
VAKILTIIPYPFYPPANGGSLRCFYLLREVARKHEVNLLTVQSAADFTVGDYPAVPENVRIISIHGEKGYRSFLNKLARKAADAVNYRLLQRTFRGSTNSYFLKAYPSLLKVLKELKPDLVFYENLETVGFFSSIVSRQLPSAIQVYDAHNIDSDLWAQLAAAQNNSVFESYAANALQAETNLYKMVDATGTCDQDGFVITSKYDLPNSNPNHLFYDSPEQCMSNLRISIQPEDIARWRERSQSS